MKEETHVAVEEKISCGVASVMLARHKANKTDKPRMMPILTVVSWTTYRIYIDMAGMAHPRASASIPTALTILLSE